METTKENIALFARLLPQLEQACFDEHLRQPLSQLRVAFDAVKSATKKETRNGRITHVVYLCINEDCLRRSRNEKSALHRDEYCSRQCYDRERGRKYRERKAERLKLRKT